MKTRVPMEGYAAVILMADQLLTLGGEIAVFI